MQSSSKPLAIILSAPNSKEWAYSIESILMLEGKRSFLTSTDKIMNLALLSMLGLVGVSTDRPPSGIRSIVERLLEQYYGDVVEERLISIARQACETAEENRYSAVIIYGPLSNRTKEYLRTSLGFRIVSITSDELQPDVNISATDKVDKAAPAVMARLRALDD